LIFREGLVYKYLPKPGVRVEEGRRRRVDHVPSKGALRMSRKTATLSVALILVCALGAPGYAAGQESRETESAVPELEALHEVIYPIWHDAYPNKDYAALRGFVAEVERLAGRVVAAELPGILRDKEAKWKAGLDELKKAVEAYKTAAAGSDDQALLVAAEALHMRYEMLVRAIRPVLKEVDAFHRVLYVVYHKYLPDRKYAEIKAVAGDLAAKAEAVTKATLSKRLEPRTAAFQDASARLVESVRKLEAACAGGAGPEIEKAVEAVHSSYQALELVFN
jgi:hypothetical protein